MDVAKKYAALLKKYKELQTDKERVENEFELYKKQTEQSYEAARTLMQELDSIKKEWVAQLDELKQQKNKCVELNRSLRSAVKIAIKHKNKR